MAKQRYINTEFWTDEFIEALEPLDRYLFLYFLTNVHTTICGIYRLPIRYITGDTKLTESQVQESLRKLWREEERNQKILYLDGWVYIKNFERHQVARGSEKVKIGIERAKKEVPRDILAKIAKISKKQIVYPYPTDTVSTFDSDSDSDSDLDLDLDGKAAASTPSEFQKPDRWTDEEIKKRLDAKLRPYLEGDRAYYAGDGKWRVCTHAGEWMDYSGSIIQNLTWK